MECLAERQRGEDGHMTCLSIAAVAQTVAGAFALLGQCLADRFHFCCLKRERTAQLC